MISYFLILFLGTYFILIQVPENKIKHFRKIWENFITFPIKIKNIRTKIV